MIRVMTDGDIGKWVIYQPNEKIMEIGRIKHFNSTWAFVVFNCAGLWHEYKNYTGQATNMEHLTFANSGG